MQVYIGHGGALFPVWFDSSDVAEWKNFPLLSGVLLQKTVGPGYGGATGRPVPTLTPIVYWRHLLSGPIAYIVESD